MRLVYLDEAGISNPKQEPFVSVAGVIIHADTKLNAVERHLDRLVRMHIPEERRDDFVFHATELFNGGGKVFVREPEDALNPKWPLEKRLRIADDLAVIPKKYGIDVALGQVRRATFLEDYDLSDSMSKKERAVLEHVVAFIQCTMQVEAWMRQNAPNEVCLLISEDNDQARMLIRDTQRAFQDRNVDFVTDSVGEHFFFPLKKIKEEPFFQKKRKSNVLQLADFCAYVYKKILMGDGRYMRFFSPWQNRIAVFDAERPERRRSQRPRRSRPRQAAEQSP